MVAIHKVEGSIPFNRLQQDIDGVCASPDGAPDCKSGVGLPLLGSIPRYPTALPSDGNLKVVFGN